MEIGEKIKHYRTSKGFSIYQLSKDTDISANHISGIEHGKRQPSIEIIKRLITPLGITLAELFNDDTDAVFLSEQERVLVENYRTLPDEKAAALFELSQLLNK